VYGYGGSYMEAVTARNDQRPKLEREKMTTALG
jgi:hypothetical protein